MTNQSNSTDSMELEEAREAIRKDIQLSEDLEGLLQDERFQRVFLENFCKKVIQDEVWNLLTSNEMVHDQALLKIKSAKALELYMESVQYNGDAARADLAQLSEGGA